MVYLHEFMYFQAFNYSWILKNPKEVVKKNREKEVLNCLIEQEYKFSYIFLFFNIKPAFKIKRLLATCIRK